MWMFLLGIMFDETLRRWVIPFLERNVERRQTIAHLFHRGATEGAFIPASREGMHYMSGTGGSFLDALKAGGGDFQARVANEAQARAAHGLVDAFANELTSGCLGAVDAECRAAMRRHLEWHKRRQRGDLSGWGIPGLNIVRRIHEASWKYGPGGRLYRHFNRPMSSSAPAPAPADAPPPDAAADDAPPPDDSSGEVSTPTDQAVYDLPQAGPSSPAEFMMGVLAMPPALRSEWARRVRARHHHHGRHPWRHRQPPGVMGWGLSSLFHHPAGKLLVSATPGGVTAVAAHQIASKALKDGTLKPDHLKKAGELAKKGRAGDHASLTKIAQIKHAAGKGDRNAEVALDRIKLAHTLQTGKASTTAAPRLFPALANHYHAGAASMQRHA